MKSNALVPNHVKIRGLWTDSPPPLLSLCDLCLLRSKMLWEWWRWKKKHMQFVFTGFLFLWLRGSFENLLWNLEEVTAVMSCLLCVLRRFRFKNLNTNVCPDHGHLTKDSSCNPRFVHVNVMFSLYIFSLHVCPLPSRWSIFNQNCGFRIRINCVFWIWIAFRNADPCV